jgi:hypothetical protein
MGQGLSDLRSSLFWELICVVQHSQQTPCGYLLDNVPPLVDFKPTILAGWQQIKAWIGELVQMDVVSIGSQTHWFQWMWINIAQIKVIQRACEFISRSLTCLVNDILSLGHHSCVVHYDDLWLWLIGLGFHE